MTNVKRYFINALLLTAVSLVMRTVSVSFNVILTEKVGAEGMGLLTLVMSVNGFAVTFATSGISLAVTRMTAETVITADKSKAPRVLSNVMSSAMIYSAAFGLTGCILLLVTAKPIGVSILGDARTVPALHLLALTLPPIALSSALSGYFNACRRVYKNAVTQVAEQAVKVTLITAGLLLLSPSGLEYALLAVVGGGALAEALSFAFIYILYRADRRRHYSVSDNTSSLSLSKPSHLLSSSPASHLLQTPLNTATEGGSTVTSALQAGTFREAMVNICSIALPVALSAYVRSGLVTTEHLLIPHRLRRGGADPTAALAAYGTLHGMSMPVILYPYAILGPFTSLLVPEISECRARGQTERIRRITERVIRVTLLFAVGVSGIMMCFSYELGNVLYDSEQAGYYIRMLAPIIPVMYLDTAVDSLLKGMGEQLYCMKVNIADASLSVIFVYFLVPVFGVTGYAAIIIIAEVINTALSITRLIRIIHPRPNLRMWLIKPFVCSFLACAAMRFIINRVPRLYGRTDGLSTALFIIAGSALYLALLTATDTVFQRKERHTADITDSDVKHTKNQAKPAKNRSIKQLINKT